MTRLYRRMDRNTLDAAYNNVPAVADFPTIMADFRQRSARIIGRTDHEQGIAYGTGGRERFDLVRAAEENVPAVLYVHGGYWQALTKEDFAFVAEGPLALDYTFITAEYTLAPEASMSRIVGKSDASWITSRPTASSLG